MTIFGPKAWVNPFGKISIFRLFELVLFIAQTGVFSLQNRVKHIFLAYCVIKIVGKMAIFGPKAWVNPFGKISIVRLFELLVFIAQTGVFSIQDIVKHIFLAYIAPKKQLEKWPLLDQKHRLTPSEKSQFFEFLNLLFLQPRQASFPSRIQ